MLIAEGRRARVLDLSDPRDRACLERGGVRAVSPNKVLKAGRLLYSRDLTSFSYAFLFPAFTVVATLLGATLIALLVHDAGKPLVASNVVALIVFALTAAAACAMAATRAQYRRNIDLSVLALCHPEPLPALGGFPIPTDDDLSHADEWELARLCRDWVRAQEDEDTANDRYCHARMTLRSKRQARHWGRKLTASKTRRQELDVRIRTLLAGLAATPLAPRR